MKSEAALIALLLAGLHAPWTLAAPINLSEVFYDAVGSDDGQSFVELYGPAGFSLEGWTLEGINGANGNVGPVVTLSGVIPADGFFVVADEDAGTTSVANADFLANFDFQNGPDSIVLRDASGAPVDAVGYGLFGAGDVFAGEGAPAPDPPAGQSLARLFANVDTDDNGADFMVLASPTPGSGPLELFEPRLFALLCACLAGFAFRRR